MRIKPGVRILSQSGGSNAPRNDLVAALCLGGSVAFGVLVWAATKPPPLGSWAAGLLLLLMIPATLVAFSRGRVGLWLWF